MKAGQRVHYGAKQQRKQGPHRQLGGELGEKVRGGPVAALLLLTLHNEALLDVQVKRLGKEGRERALKAAASSVTHNNMAWSSLVGL